MRRVHGSFIAVVAKATSPDLTWRSTARASSRIRCKRPILRSEVCSTKSSLLRIGLEVSSDCAIVDRQGNPSQQLFAVGPLTRAAFWEIIAVPDIRDQCAELAARLIRRGTGASTAVKSDSVQNLSQWAGETGND